MRSVVLFKKQIWWWWLPVLVVLLFFVGITVLFEASLHILLVFCCRLISHGLGLHQFCTPMIHSCTSAYQPATQTNVKRLTACLVDITAWLKACPADSDWIPAIPRWCGWVRCSSSSRWTSPRFRVHRRSSKSGRWRVTWVSSLTVGCCCLHRWLLYVTAATTSYGNSDQLSDPCHLISWGFLSRRSFPVAWTTATHCSRALMIDWWPGCSMFRMLLCVWCRVSDGTTSPTTSCQCYRTPFALASSSEAGGL